MQITRDNLKNEHEWSVRQNKHDTKQYIYRSDGRNQGPSPPERMLEYPSYKPENMGLQTMSNRNEATEG